MATTKTTNQPKDRAALRELAERLREWRESRRRGQRIPEELWKAATELGRIHGVSPTASALKVNFLQLQQRLLAGGFGRGQGAARPAFIELAPVASPPDQGERGTLEVVQASGARLTLRLPRATAKELQPLVHLFLRERL